MGSVRQAYDDLVGERDPQTRSKVEEMLSTGLGITDYAHLSTTVDLLDEILSNRNDVAHPAECDCELSGAAHLLVEECNFMIIETVIKNLEQHQASNALSPKEKLIFLVLKRRREVGHVPHVTQLMGVK